MLTAILVIAMATPGALAQEEDFGPDPDPPVTDAPPVAEYPLYPMVFPVGGTNSFTDTFGAPRDGDRFHQGTDIFADKLTPVLAVADGIVTTMRTDGVRAGVYVVVLHSDGWSSLYLHLNNDTPGTDDGLGFGFADGLAVGSAVVAGQVIGFVGDSGNAEETPPHLHFELHDPVGVIVNPYPHLAAATGIDPGTLLGPATGTAAPAVVIPPVETLNTTYVGHFDPGGGFNSDVWVVDDIAYLSAWGREGACPTRGVRMIDVADPTQPTLIGTFADGTAFPASSAEDLWVGPVETATFQGKLAVVAIRLCDTSERSRYNGPFRGVALYDVTDPTQPQLLSTIDTGARTQGVHELEVMARADGQILAVFSVPQSFLHHPEAKGDTRIVDITDPFVPLELADWDFRRDAPAELVEPLLAARGDEELRGHGVRFIRDGRELYISHWDAGMVRIDITNPAAPVFVSATSYDGGEEGNAHSGWYDPNGRFLVTNDEDLHALDDEDGHIAGWGYQRIFDLADPTLPVQVGAFATENAIPGTDGEVGLDGFYTAHDLEVSGDLAVAAWYSDGVRILDLSDLTNPIEIGYFIPPPAADPHGYWVAPDGTTAFPAVWGVRLVGDLVFASDINSGLWIFRIGEQVTTTVDVGLRKADAVEAITDPEPVAADPATPEPIVLDNTLEAPLPGTDPGAAPPAMAEQTPPGDTVDTDGRESTDPGDPAGTVDPGDTTGAPESAGTVATTDDTGPAGGVTGTTDGVARATDGSALDERGTSSGAGVTARVDNAGVVGMTGRVDTTLGFRAPGVTRYTGVTGTTGGEGSNGSASW